LFSTDLTLEGSAFQSVGALTAKPLVPLLILTLGTKCDIFMIFAIVSSKESIYAFNSTVGNRTYLVIWRRHNFSFLLQQ